MTAAGGEAAEEDVDVIVPGHRDVGELHIGDRLRHLGRMGEQCAVICGAREVDPDAAGSAGETRPREVHVVVARAVDIVISLDRRLVVELAEQIRRGGAACHEIVPRIAALPMSHPPWPVAGKKRGNPYVAERLRRAGRIVRALRAEEGSPCASQAITGHPRSPSGLRFAICPYGDTSSG